MLGACEIRPSENSVIKNGEVQHIEPKSMAVLLYLAANEKGTVLRDDLISTIWPRGFVTDDVLSRCISQLRAALGDSAKTPTYIATVPRKGYRLLQSVKLATFHELDGVLVLPFQHLAAHGKGEYLADGLTELLIARLAVALDQRVISRTTTMTFKGRSPDMLFISRELGVKWVIEGSLLQLGKQLQVVVQLVDAEADKHNWAETWLRPAEDIMTVLNEISRQISTQVNEKLNSPAKNNDDAVELPDELVLRYVQGIHHVSKRTAVALRQAVTCFSDVLTQQPEHAPALGGISTCYVLLAHYGAEKVEVGMAKAREFAERALNIDPKNSDALSALGAVCFFYDWDFEKASELAETALRYKPNFELALMLAANVNLVKGSYEKSQCFVDIAIRTDPLNVGVLMNAGDLLILQRRYGEAIKSLMQALELEPGFRPACLRLALAYSLHGQHQEATTKLRAALRLGGEDAQFFEYQAMIRAQAGDDVTAKISARKLQKMSDDGEVVLPWALARAWAAAGEPDIAVGFLEQAYSSASSSIPFLGQTPLLHSVRDRAEVQELIKRIGLPSIGKTNAI